MVLEVPGEGYRGCRCHSAFRSWMRSLIDQAHVAHELHFLDVNGVPDSPLFGEEQRQSGYAFS